MAEKQAWAYPGEEVEALARRVAREFLDKARRHGSQFVAQVRQEAIRAKVPGEFLAYVFFTIGEAREGWPPMPAWQRNALLVGRELMYDANAAPAWRSGLRTPEDRAVDALVDRAIMLVSAWCAGPLAMNLAVEWGSTCQAHAREARALMEGVQPGREVAALDLLVSRSVHADPRWYGADADLLAKVMDLIHGLGGSAPAGRG